ncbi:MAG TPA: copper chaperone PCu(A)C [Brevundimonas sp.]|nr:copper chaperone PCu(A)C [Brevundimonas sp.]
MIRTLIPLAAVTLLAACSNEPRPVPAGEQSAVAVTDAVCRPTPTGRKMTGCYLTLTAGADDRLLSIATPVAGRVEIHESKIESNMMMMRELKEGLPLPAGQAVELKPGGNHIMLLAVETPIVAGQTVPLTLTFASAPPVVVQAAVGQPKTTEDDVYAAH